MKGFLEKHPGIRFDVKCYEEPAVLDEMLDNGDVDFGFTVLPDADASFEKVFLKKDPMMIVLAENHPLADLPYFPSSSMSEEPYISVGDHSEMDALFYYNNVKPNTYLMLDNDFCRHVHGQPGVWLQRISRVDAQVAHLSTGRQGTGNIFFPGNRDCPALLGKRL